MIRLNAAYSKKVPGAEPYSSEGLSLSVEMELPDAVLADQQRFSDAVRSLFRRARDEVEEQSRLGNQHGPSTTNGHLLPNSRPTPPPAPPASKRQLDFLLSVAQRNANLSPRELLLQAGVDKLTDLTRPQASELIERFQNGGSG